MYNVLYKDNFLVLKGTTTQFPIFAIGLVIKNTLEKNHELWLVLQNMWKAYDSVGWEHLKKSLVKIKICSKFIQFFGSIYGGHINRVMTDFGLTNKYPVHDDLDQKKVFLSFFWHIFYDLLLCEVKKQKSLCGYKLNSYFVFKTGCAESQARLIFFFTASAFVNDTIWVGCNQKTIQYILNIASDFFHINNIFINNNKTVAISINCSVKCLSLLINRLPISIAKKSESYCYLGIYLFTDGFSKPSLAKAHSDVWFFANFVLKKTISDKQFLYLVSAVLYLIIGYKTQFSFIFSSVCNK
ncbi:hypothetical protein G9A89_018250 [Geosiphon pyriformis]|nr:hypothetical protein G9A89_018250 [Geosiphon pyriformis]